MCSTTLQCPVLHKTALQRPLLDSTALQCSILCWTGLQCDVLHSTALQCPVLHRTGLQCGCTTVRCSVHHCTAEPCSTQNWTFYSVWLDLTLPPAPASSCLALELNVERNGAAKTAIGLTDLDSLTFQDVDFWLCPLIMPWKEETHSFNHPILLLDHRNLL